MGLTRTGSQHSPGKPLGHLLYDGRCVFRALLQRVAGRGVEPRPSEPTRNAEDSGRCRFRLLWAGMGSIHPYRRLEVTEMDNSQLLNRLEALSAIQQVTLCQAILARLTMNPEAMRTASQSLDPAVRDDATFLKLAAEANADPA